MNELEMVRDLRTSIPADPSAAVQRGRERLLELLHGELGARPGASHAPRRRRRRRLRFALGLAAAIAASAATVIVLRPNTRTATPVAPSNPAPTLTNVRLTAEVLGAAARSAEGLPARRPHPHQWIYSVIVQSGYRTPRGSSGNWLRFDGRVSAYYGTNRKLIVHVSPVPPVPAGSHGALVAFVRNITPLTTYDALASLPRDPARMLTTVASFVSRHPGAAFGGAATPPRHATRAQLQFAFLANLLWNGTQAAPPSAVAAVFRTMATIPGVHVIEGLRSAAGQPSIGVVQRGSEQQLLLDPHNYRVIGMRTVSDGSWPANPVKRVSARLRKGTVVYSLAWARIAFVARPGLR